MAGVAPKAPGVPPLLQFGDPTTLVTADIFAGIGSIVNEFIPQWGIQSASTGALIILPTTPAIAQFTTPVSTALALAGIAGLDVPLAPVFASTASFEYAKDWRIADYQVEQGSFENYDKVELPFDVKVTLVNDDPTPLRQTFLATIDGMARSFDLYNVLTPEKVYLNCSVAHYDYKKTARSGVSMLIVDVWFQEIRETALTTFLNTAIPGISDQAGLGAVTSSSPPAGLIGSLGGIS